MSLINDALKKAQKQRTGDSPSSAALPSVGGEPAQRIAKRGKPIGFNSMVLWIGGGAGVLVVLLVGGFFLVRVMTSPPPAPPAPVAKPVAPVVAQIEVPKPAEGASVPVSAPAKPIESTPTTFVLPGVPATKTEAATGVPPVTPLVAEAKPLALEPVVVAPTPPPIPPPETPKVVLKMDQKAVTYIEGVRVAGIRFSSTDSKVLMNDHVYRVGDTVEHQLGLKLAVITAGALTFEDERGARYTRNF